MCTAEGSHSAVPDGTGRKRVPVPDQVALEKVAPTAGRCSTCALSGFGSEALSLGAGARRVPRVGGSGAEELTGVHQMLGDVAELDVGMLGRSTSTWKAPFTPQIRIPRSTNTYDAGERRNTALPPTCARVTSTHPIFPQSPNPARHLRPSHLIRAGRDDHHAIERRPPAASMCRRRPRGGGALGRCCPLSSPPVRLDARGAVPSELREPAFRSESGARYGIRCNRFGE
jgi:hypothetical protein